ncbi:hypothetical protein AMATHDRAFT_41049 [Amanita thiersii Skay4041]|uniref:Uncharacterized protein n=1 Tax=Amanita thiersii Skay4041 TaxID=703135 RepID=A0A2A9NHQ6_9AGAR|nr:hypothetical protein AMATHDRAFT_41049 [Amanita thiersii Skay4041]
MATASSVATGVTIGMGFGVSGSRKKPHCRTCGLPMEGHRRERGTPVCPPTMDRAGRVSVNGGGVGASPNANANGSGNATPRQMSVEIVSPPPSPPITAPMHSRRGNLPNQRPPPPPQQQYHYQQQQQQQQNRGVGASDGVSRSPGGAGVNVKTNIDEEYQRQQPPLRVSPPRPIPMRGEELLDLPPKGSWHWRNPNWIDPPSMPSTRLNAPQGMSTPIRDQQRVPPLPSGSRAAAANGGRATSSENGSLVPTVLVDEDGNTIRGSNKCEGSDDESSSMVRSVETTSSMLMDRLAELSKPVVSIFNTKREDIPKIRNTAARLGIYTGVVHVPNVLRGRAVKEEEEEEGDGDHVDRAIEEVMVSAHGGATSAATSTAAARGRKRPIGREYSWWLILGQNKTNVQHIVDAQQRGIPGMIATDKELVEGPRMITLMQVIFLGVIGGLVVLCGLAMFE